MSLYPASTHKIRECLLSASAPRTRADFLRLLPDGGTLRRAVALLKANGECFTARDPAMPQRVLYWFSRDERDAWLADEKGGRLA